MDGKTTEITRKSVLLECLDVMRQKLKICSKAFNMLEPARGMEERFRENQAKCEILKDLIHAYDSEPVKIALANWQKQVMKEDAEGKPHQMTI